MGKRSDTLAGTLDLLILKTLSHGDNHGFGITLHIQNASRGLVHLEEGSLYPALHRLEREKLIRGDWRITENTRRARFYALTASGRKHLEEAEEQWSRLSRGVQAVLRFA